MPECDYSTSDIYGYTWLLSPLRLAELGVSVAASNAAVAESTSGLIFLAVKPNLIPTVLSAIRDHVGDACVVSIAAGVTLAALEAGLKPGTRVVRVMPNTPCLVGQTAAGYAAGTAATPADMLLVGSLLGSVGTAVEVQPKDLDAVTGLSGSGPAYVFLLIEALADGGVRNGLPRQTALALAAQTVKGAAEMVLSTGRHPGDLKDAVCSPGGTTIAGVEALEQAGFRYAAMSAVSAATARSKELGKPKM